MDLSILPTDNLYKLMSLSGLAISAFTTYTYMRHRTEIDNALERLEKDLASSEVKAEYVASEIEALEKDITQLKIAMKKARDSADEDESSRLLGLVKESAGQAQRVHRLNYRLKLSTTRSLVTIQRMKRLIKKLRVISSVSALVFAFGLLLAGCGFSLWYFRLQRFQDMEIARSSASKDAVEGTKAIPVRSE